MQTVLKIGHYLGSNYSFLLCKYRPVLIITLLQKKATGQELLEKIHYQMDIIEKDYFGLQYTDHNHVSHWLDPTKPVKKQVKSKIFIV